RRHTRFSRDWSSDVCSSDLIRVENREVKVDSFPMSIDYEKFHRAAEEQAHKKEKTSLKIRVNQYKELVPDSKLILSIDRLDYTRSEERRVGKECRLRTETRR